ncbi:PhzF family phenazine biosynthesis protein [Desulfosporosinus nitroreducens]|uniref:PhzF family phenazine biosynthesis protein n=1 Tax=Desulfosporosinus nitroreducens TaxID=2018668 RepID=UPI00207C9989|nr:PhzF family phenazine biosynthesis isomerase [Desulfosporosinus nitroreducens]MCO1603781.1 PhzF family phenazine biosynthesis isomerase [Desulfosporosinus nitroreducens]
MKVNVYTLNSFAKTKEGGNAAGVVTNADSLSEKEMRKIAAILGISETAFILRSNVADFNVRFFTPNEEVDLCGHATIATFYTMASLGLLKPGTYKQETKAGILGIEIKEDNSIMMNQPVPVFSEIIDKDELADSLNIKASQMPEDLSVQVVSTGLRDIMVPVKSIKILNAIKPDMEKIKKISQKYNAVGYHVFALESLHGAYANCRNFAPLYDIPEESATGTSNGALGCYLYHYGKINNEQASNIVFEQGYSMKKPSEILVSLTVKENEILEVKVGGNAMNLALSEVEI